VPRSQRAPPDAQQLAHLALGEEHRSERLARVEVEGELPARVETWLFVHAVGVDVVVVLHA
jgi:hypothetical protein